MLKFTYNTKFVCLSFDFSWWYDSFCELIGNFCLYTQSLYNPGNHLCNTFSYYFASVIQASPSKSRLKARFTFYVFPEVLLLRMMYCYTILIRQMSMPSSLPKCWIIPSFVLYLWGSSALFWTVVNNFFDIVLLKL